MFVIFCSTLSSGLNSLTAVFLEDFIKPLLKRLDFNVSEQKLTLLSKIVGEKSLE